MSQEDQRYALASAAAAAYAKKQARDEARKTLIISTALNQNMASLDPKTQEDLRQLLQAKARRVEQENFDWEWEWRIVRWVFGLMVLGFVLFILIALGSVGESYSRSYNTATSSASPEATTTPEATCHAHTGEADRTGGSQAGNAGES